MKFDFGDLYKFIVSAGLALAGISFLTLWLLLKEPFDLLVKESQLWHLTEVAQETIRYRQEIVAKMVRYALWIAPVTIIFGLLISFWGMRRWKKLQSIADELADLDLERRKFEVRPKTEDEALAVNVYQEPTEGARLALEPNTPPPRAGTGFTHFTVRQPSTRLGGIEHELARRLNELVPDHYEVQQEMMVGDSGVDILLKGSKLLDKDYLIEVKHIRKGFNFNWLMQVVLKLKAISLSYQQITNRIPNTCLIVAVDDSAWNEEKYMSLRSRAINELAERTHKTSIAIMRTSEIKDLSADAAARKLGLPIKR